MGAPTAAPTPETKVEEKEVPPKRMFSKSNIVHRFHPIAWVEQMRRVFGTGNCSQCEKDFTYEQIKAIFPAAAKNETLAKQLIDELNLVREKHKINTCQKKAHLITQFGSETGFNTLIEDLAGYSVSALKKFSYFARNPNEAKLYLGNTKEIAMRAYGLRSVDKEKDIVTCVGLSKTEKKLKKCNDLGNKTMLDGYSYMGRGLIQLTGRYNYENINKKFQKAFPDEGDLLANPQLLEQPKYAVMSAMSYWINKNLNKLADEGGYSQVNKITGIINKGLSKGHYAKRRNSFVEAFYAFNLSTCKLQNSQTNSDLKIKEGLAWAESIAITETQLKANPKTPYIINYNQESGKEGHLRTEQTEKGIAKMDCSELVCRYLQKIEWSENVEYITSNGLVDYAAQHPDKLIVNNGNPKVGDIFAWRGHTGIIKSYDSSTKKIVTIESIREKSYSWHEGIFFKGVVIWTYTKDLNHLKSKKGKKVHYYTPINHYSK